MFRIEMLQEMCHRLWFQKPRTSIICLQILPRTSNFLMISIFNCQTLICNGLSTLSFWRLLPELSFLLISLLLTPEQLGTCLHRLCRLESQKFLNWIYFCHLTYYLEKHKALLAHLCVPKTAKDFILCLKFKAHLPFSFRVKMWTFLTYRFYFDIAVVNSIKF